MRDYRELKRIYGIWYDFCNLGKSFSRPMKNDWVWRKVFERYITILSFLVAIIGVLFFQLVSLFGKLESKLESFSTE